MITITPVAGSPLAALGAAVPCLCPDADTLALAGPLDDLPAYHPAYYAEPLPLPPRLDRRAPALGRIAWPCWGLTRFAAGHVLLAADAIAGLEATADYDGRVWVALDDGTDTVTLTMRVVARRPLVDPRPALDAAVDESAPMAWVVSLTDDRWDRAGKIYATASTGTPATWGDLLEEVLDAAGYTVAAAGIDALLALYSPAYDAPSATWFARPLLNGRPAVVLADAIAAACGLRIAVGGDGEIEVQGPDAAGDAWADWLAVSGGATEFGGLIETAGKTRPLTVEIYPSGGTVALTRTLADGVRGTLDISAQPAISSNCADRIADDIARWMDPNGAEATLVGFVPVPVSAVPVEVGWETAEGRSWVSDGPAWWPWPLVGTPAVAVVGMGGGGGGGPCVDVVTKICQDTYGTITVEYKTICLPAGATVSEAFCLPPSTDCCESASGAGPCTDSQDPWYTTATVSNPTGDCGCMPATLTRSGHASPEAPFPDHQYWTTNTCPGNLEWHLICNGDEWELWVGGNYADPTGGGAVQCTPVSHGVGILVFDSPDLGANCGGSGGTVRITITV